MAIFGPYLCLRCEYRNWLCEQVMEELPFNLSLSLNLVTQLVLIYIIRMRVLRGIMNEESAKIRFTIISILLTFAIAAFGYYGLSKIFGLFGVDIFHGHAGIAFVLPFVVSVVVGFLSATLGRYVIGWKEMQW
jgi:hypothetical protein